MERARGGDQGQAGRPGWLFEFLEGDSRGWGMFQNLQGTVKRRFVIEANGRWVGSRFELSEVFTYDDGKIETRTWHLSMSGEQTFSATCADCVGKARGRLTRDSAEMRYVFRLKLENRVIDLDFHDRFVPVGRDGLMNRAQVKKFGIKVGEVTAFFMRAGATDADMGETRMAEAAE